MDRPILSLTDHRKQVGRRLDMALEALGLDQVRAAEIMGVSKQSVTDWIKGRGYPPTYGCYRLHKMTGVTYDWLFLGDWGALPARLAERLQPDLSGLSAGPSEAENQEAGTDAAA